MNFDADVGLVVHFGGGGAGCTAKTLSITEVGDGPLRRTFGGFDTPGSVCDNCVTTAATVRAAFFGDDGLGRRFRRGDEEVATREAMSRLPVAMEAMDATP